MSGLSIRAGGVVQVDTGTLRDVALRMRRLAGESAESSDAVRSAAARAGAVDPAPAIDVLVAASALATAAETAAKLAGALDQAAVLYETVEVLAQRSVAEASGDIALAAALDARLRATALDHPALLARARTLVAEYPSREELSDQALAASLTLGLLGPLYAVMAGALLAWGVEFAGVGTVRAGDRLTGGPDRIVLRATGSPPTVPPPTLAAAAARIPGGGTSRVRVERYAMPDGSAQFALYVAGTQSVGGRDPFDMRSNLQLYAGERAASYDAVTAALRAAGASPGDVVHAFGHSQGAMIAERLALEGPYDLRTLASFGSPVQAEVGDGTLAVSVRHTDDPVAALQAGGSPAAVGAPGSFVVERIADPGGDLADVLLPGHQMTAYAQTAAMIDASHDPRVDRLRGVFAELAEAESVRTVEYEAERVSPGASSAAG
ncbi:hypothetical protein ACTU3I_02635 [Microbacterium sp. RD1]|uniref:hypothetical protein n=1 Tax=Microbacterium sp. RD1 TaxID=3457313 RepID=UPI003FA5308A